MNKSKKNINDYVKASSHGEFDANKGINRTKTFVHKNKKRYTRKQKHKSKLEQ